MKLPQLTLRDLFWLVLVVGMGLGWWMQHRSLISQLKLAETRLEVYEGQLHTHFIADGMVSPPSPLGGSLPFYERQTTVTAEEVIRLLKNEEDSITFEVAVMNVQGRQLRDDLVEPVLELLESKNVQWQERAIFTLGYLESQPEEVVPALIPFLRSPHLTLQSNALHAIGKYGEDAREAIPALRSLMGDDESQLAAAAAWHLRQVDPSVEIESRLRELLNHPLASNRQTAARIFARDSTIPVAGAIGAIEKRLAIEDNENVRKELARALNNARASTDE